MVCSSIVRAYSVGEAATGAWTLNEDQLSANEFELLHMRINPYKTNMG